MSTPAERLAFDADAYLAWEAEQREKHEYLRGEVFAMVGARQEHVLVALNVASALKQRLRGGPCRAYVSDMKLRVAAADAFFYPDVMVSCDARDRVAEHYLEHPILIVEILSPGTEAFDRGAKAAAYRLLPALREYVLIDIAARRAEAYRRTEEGDWLLHDCRPEDGTCRFASVEVSLAFDEIFEDLPPTD
ncbi:Uma2 family endonuclease [Thioalkalicoccus limnaeus]|uniref:Uma2 family endonuclease n=1 Tax=Thioalkalicoccus limnaeus TaxID=120681 RepID=A0ABV4BES5_9GAMM